MSDLPDLPNIGASNFLSRVREILQVLKGDSDNAAVKVGDLIDAGVIAKVQGSTLGTAAPFEAVLPASTAIEYVPDLSAPPQPTGVTMTAGLTGLFFKTDNPTFTVGHGYMRTRVYGTQYSGTGALPTYTEGVTQEITSFIGTVGDYSVSPGAEWHVWMKWESVDGVSSIVAGGTNGVSATAGKIGGVNIGPLAVTAANLADQAVDLTSNTVKASTNFGALAVGYAVTQYLTAKTGQMDNLIVQSAQIANLSVSKLTAGNMQVGSYLRSTSYVAGSSGWTINADGSAEMNNLTLRGTVYALGGQIGGINVNVNGIYTTNWNGLTSTAGVGFFLQNNGSLFVNSLNARGEINTGAYNGYAWPAAGAGGGAHLSGSGLMLGSVNDGKYFQVTYTGDVYAPGFSIVGGAATFYGALSAASGTFSGALSAAQINVGPSNAPVTFIDGQQPGLPLRSVAHGTLNYSGDTTVSYYDPNSGTTQYYSPPITGAAVTFYTYNYNAAITVRIRTGTVRFFVTASGTVDNNLSIWYRINGGSWGYIGGLVEPQASYGTATVSGTLEVTFAINQAIEFGMSPSDVNMNLANYQKGRLDYGSLSVLAFNF